MRQSWLSPSLLIIAALQALLHGGKLSGVSSLHLVANRIRLEAGSPLTIKILVVDRDGHIQSMIRDSLTSLECQVITASSTALAVFLARKNFPSFVVLNVSFPDDEFELPQEIANDPELAHIPVVVFVPPAQTELAKHIAQIQNVRVLVRPDSSEVLRSELVPYLRELIDDREKETTE